MDPMELRNVNIEPDEEESVSGESAQDSYTGMGNLEKAAMSSQFTNEDAESQKFLTNGFLGEKKLADYDDEHHPGTTSFGMSSFNLSNAIMGSGILGLSYAMANTGIILFIIMLLAVAILSLYSVHLLLKTAKEGGSLIYEKLGEKAFGWPGKIGAFVSITMQNIGVFQVICFPISFTGPNGVFDPQKASTSTISVSYCLCPLAWPGIYHHTGVFTSSPPLQSPNLSFYSSLLSSLNEQAASSFFGQKLWV